MRLSRLTLILGATFAMLLLAACRTPSTPGAPSATPTAPPSASTTGRAPASATASPLPAIAEPRPIALMPVSDRKWSRPTESGVYPSATGGAPGTFVAEQDGVLYEVASGGQITPILDLTERVLRAGNEQGLLSVALDPGFATNRFVWVFYSTANPTRNVLARFTRNASSSGIDRSSQLVILEQPKTFSNHNGGAIRFGADGMLYLGLGDGGSAGDPSANGQNLGVLLGKIIRIDVRNASTSQPYAIPADNPFVGRSGARGEIWAYGFRNPWRMTFDPPTGALWVGDVGQDAIEEVDVVTRGGNYGWRTAEGDRCYRPSSGCDRTGLTEPVVTYAHSAGRCSIVGGFVYRGTKVPAIAGSYIYGDTCTGEVWAINPAKPTPVLIASGAGPLSSFAVEADGEITLLSFGRSITRVATKP